MEIFQQAGSQFFYSNFEKYVCHWNSSQWKQKNCFHAKQINRFFK